MEKKVSIVLPVYNGEKYLRLALDSILSQTYTNFELIIIDDCSSDTSYAIARSYAKRDKRIRVYRNRENKKLPKSLNAGFHLASGELFTWTSDDNLLKPNTIESLVAIFEENTDIDFVYADIIPIDGQGKIIHTMPYLNGEPEDIYLFNPVLACFMYKKKIQDILRGYNPNAFLAEDYDFWMRIYESGYQMYHLKKKLYYYRFHENSLTSMKRIEGLNLQIRLLRRNIRKEKDIRKKIMILKRIVKFTRITKGSM